MQGRKEFTVDSLVVGVGGDEEERYVNGVLPQTDAEVPGAVPGVGQPGVPPRLQVMGEYGPHLKPVQPLYCTCVCVCVCV